jgi:hypothetical protein
VAACINPEHLEAVTHAENVRRGKTTKLAGQAVKQIRAALESGESRLALAMKYDVSVHCITDIALERTWRG